MQPHRLLVSVTLALLTLSLPRTAAAALTSIDFEDLIDGGDVGTHFPGLTFSGATVLTSRVSLNEIEYPARSGSHVAACDGGTVSIRFAVPITRFAGYFTHSSALTIQAFNGSNAVARSVSSAFGRNLAVSGDSSSSPNELIQLTVPSGIFEIRITGAGAGNGSFTLDDLSVDLAPYGPVIATPSSLVFGAVKAAASQAMSFQTPAQDVTVTFPGAPSGWTATADQPWVRVTNGSGAGAGRFTVALVNPSDVVGASTALSATITVGSPTATNATLSIPVKLAVERPGASTEPFGVFDTPVASPTSLAGSFAVTGWALDDIGIDRVEIWRDPVLGETTPPYQGSGPGHGKIFIANPLFVSGARPDVESAYGTSPAASRAGWGYLLLSWGLWNQGNGPFTLYAFAYDIEGHAVTLGSKSIVVDNAHATKPFGALDTPGYGATMSGAFQNFGWALTPNAVPPCVIVDGNVQVSIDSSALVPVNYGGNRTDIAAQFPGFSNGTNAGGAYYIDTTTLGNGIHQIAWYVVDNCGRADGVGSRFFTVLNGDTPVTPSASANVAAAAVPPEVAVVPNHVDATQEPIQVRRGADITWVYPNPSGDRVVPIGQSERVELQLPALNGATYTGYQLVNGERRPLPLGSSLDTGMDTFSWQPGAGFLGVHDLEFVPNHDAGSVRVRAIVGTGVQAVIDTPQPGVVPLTFVVAGWAADLAAANGTGIDTVHMWAYPATGEPPIFLGVAAYGDARPDVAALLGDQFLRVSYSLTISRLAPGTYDLVVYPHSAVTGDFQGARVVRVKVS